MWHVFLAEAEVLPALLGGVHIVKAPDDHTVDTLLPTKGQQKRK